MTMPDDDTPKNEKLTELLALIDGAIGGMTPTKALELLDLLTEELESRADQIREETENGGDDDE